MEAKSDFILHHFESVRSIPYCRDSKIIIVPESNLGDEGKWFAHYIKDKLDASKYVFMYEDGENGVGVRTTADLKAKMALTFSTVLNNKCFKFHKDFKTITHNMTPNLMKEEIVKQSKNYCIKLQRVPNNKFAPPTMIYTGKDGYGYDDVIITIQMNKVIQMRFMTNTLVYGKYH